MSAGNDKRLTLIAGLGNPGKEYEGTRHNAGFEAVDRILPLLRCSFEKHDAYSSFYWKGRFRGRNLFLQKPLTYMNLSGKAVSSLMRKNRITPEELILIYDDMDLPLGKIRIKRGGGSAGHNGVESVIQETGSADFVRLRIGIGRVDSNSQVDHVLSAFSAEEKALFDKVADLSAEAVKLALCRDLNTVMTKYNGCRVELDTES